MGKRYEKCEKQQGEKRNETKFIGFKHTQKIQLCDQELREAGKIMKRQGIRSFGDLFSPARSQPGLVLKFKD